MKKTLLIYLLRNFWGTLGSIIFIFIFLTFFADLLDSLDNLISFQVSFGQYLQYYLHTAPMVFIICLPIAVLLSVMKVFRDLSISNEYIALIMGGISLKTMITPIIISCLFLCVLSHYISDKIAPSSKAKRKLIIKEKFRLKRIIIKNRSIIGSHGKHYFLSEYNKKNKTIKNMMIIETDFKTNDILKRTFAEKLVWDNGEWLATNVRFQKYENGIPKKPEIKEKYIFKKTITPENILLTKNNAEYLNNRRLRRLIRSIPDSKANRKLKTGLEVNYYRRFSLSFLPLVLFLIGIHFSIAPIRNFTSKPLGFGIIICIVYYFVDAIFYQAGRGGFLTPPLAAWMANILFAGIGLIFIKRIPH